MTLLKNNSFRVRAQSDDEDGDDDDDANDNSNNNLDNVYRFIGCHSLIST